MTVRVTITILILAAGSSALADDVGLISARLIERTDHEYVIETDVMPQMIGLLGEPILPGRFTLDGKPDYRRQGAMVAVRYVFRGNAPLAADDVLLLPWNRMGVILEARWLDGTQTGALFSRRPEGIPVTIASLRPEVKAPAEVFQEQWRNGFLGAATGLGHWLLVMSLVLLLPFGRVAASLLMFLCGLVLALVVTEITTPEIPILLGKALS